MFFERIILVFYNVGFILDGLAVVSIGYVNIVLTKLLRSANLATWLQRSMMGARNTSSQMITQTNWEEKMKVNAKILTQTV